MKPSDFKTVGIIGAGLMGRTIGLINAECGLKVRITDTAEAMLDQALAWIGKETSAVSNVTPTVSLADFADCDLILETIVESLKPKRQVLSRLEIIVGHDTVLASNASVIPIGQIAAGLERPHRMCGIHFCHPARYRPVVEIIAAETTNAATVATAFEYARRIGRDAVRVKDTTGFVVNRALHPYMNEAQVLLLEGASLEEIDTSATNFGMPWGPLTQLDEIGLDTIIRGAHIMSKAYPDRPLAGELLVGLIELGRYGCKTQAGFYKYDHDGKRFVDRDVELLIEKHRKGQRRISEQEIAARLFGRMGEEAARIVAEGVVAERRDVEVALCTGLGYPLDKTFVLWQSGGSEINHK